MQLHVEGEEVAITRSITIKNFINQGLLVREVANISKKMKATSRSHPRHLTAAKKLIVRVKHYDRLSSLVQANAGIDINQLVRGNAKEAETIARELSREKHRRKVLAAVEMKIVPRPAVFDDS